MSKAMSTLGNGERTTAYIGAFRAVCDASTSEEYERQLELMRTGDESPGWARVYRYVMAEWLTNHGRKIVIGAKIWCRHVICHVIRCVPLRSIDVSLPDGFAKRPCTAKAALAPARPRPPHRCYSAVHAAPAAAPSSVTMRFSLPLSTKILQYEGHCDTSID